MSKRSRNILGGLAIIGVSAGVIGAMAIMKKPITEVEAEPEKARFVTTTHAQRGDFSVMHQIIGRVEAAAANEVMIEAAKKVVALYAKNGQWVAEGTLLAQLDDQDAQRELARLQAQLQDALANQSMQIEQHKLNEALLAIDQKQLKQAQDNFKREQALKNLTSNSRLEQLAMDVDSRQQGVLQRQTSVNNHAAQRQQMQATLTQLQLAIEAQTDMVAKHQWRAPIAGVVADLNVKVGQLAPQGQIGVRIIDNSELYFKTTVDSNLAKQNNASIELAGQRFYADGINPVVTEQRAGQTVAFRLSQEATAANRAEFAIGENLYANWVSPAINNSYLLADGALFEFDRVYALVKPTIADELVAPIAVANEVVNSAEGSTNDVAELETTAEAKAIQPLGENDYHLKEIKVQLHGSTWFDGQEYWVVTSELLPESATLLTSRLKTLYSGLLVTDTLVIDKPQTEEVAVVNPGEHSDQAVAH